MLAGLVVADTRTGSTFFCEAVDNHSHLVYVGEAFQLQGDPLHKVVANSPEQFIEQAPSWAFAKIMYFQMEKHGLLNWMIEKKELPIVHLYRENALAKVVSDHLSAAAQRTEKLEGLKAEHVFDEVMVYKGKVNERHVQLRNKREKYCLISHEQYGKKADGKYRLHSEVGKVICETFKVRYHHPLEGLRRPRPKLALKTYLEDIYDELAELFEARARQDAWMLEE